MCRWLAYAGNPIALEELLFAPANSLIRQSLSARHSIVPTNGDGFGLGWYGDHQRPGLFRDTLPAWNDANLRSLSEQIRSRLFFAHVRASTGTSTSRENCHPFRFGDTLFMHNGRIGGYLEIRRELEALIPTSLYAHRQGTTDSEAFFLLALANGLLEDPVEAFTRTVTTVLEVMRRNDVTEPFRMTAAFTDGRRLAALRTSSDSASPTLFHAEGGGVEVRDGTVALAPGDGTLMVLSEPLDEVDTHWHEVPEGHLLVAGDGAISVSPLPVAVGA